MACEANGDCSAIMVSTLSCYLLKCPKPVPYPDYRKYQTEVEWFRELVSEGNYAGYYQIESGKHYSIRIINKCYRSKPLH